MRVRGWGLGVEGVEHGAADLMSQATQNPEILRVLHRGTGQRSRENLRELPENCCSVIYPPPRRGTVLSREEVWELL